MLNSCKSAGGIFRVGNYTSVRDCTNLANALTSRPISVVVDANNFQFYTSGIFYNCGTNLSLGALLVGMRWFFFLWHFSTDFSALYRFYAIFMRISCDFYANFMRISGFYANLRGFMRIA